MEKQTLLQKIRSVKYCLMAHPHNEPDSEFADRIDDLQEIEDSLAEHQARQQPVRKTLDECKDEVSETEDVNLLKRRLEFYRSETAKIRDYVFDDANKCGYPTQSIFEAITDKIDALKAELYAKQSQQNPDGYLIEFDGDLVTEKALPAYDFLRSKGYALPFRNLSVEQLIEMGWLTLTNN